MPSPPQQPQPQQPPQQPQPQQPQQPLQPPQQPPAETQCELTVEQAAVASLWCFLRSKGMPGEDSPPELTWEAADAAAAAAGRQAHGIAGRMFARVRTELAKVAKPTEDLNAALFYRLRAGMEATELRLEHMDAVIAWLQQRAAGGGPSGVGGDDADHGGDDHHSADHSDADTVA